MRTRTSEGEEGREWTGAEGVVGCASDAGANVDVARKARRGGRGR
jgi:hypothetical protein